MLEDGRVAETGTYAQLVQNRNSRFRELMAEQLAAAETQPHVLPDVPDVEVVEEVVEHKEDVDASEEQGDPEQAEKARIEKERAEWLAKQEKGR
jgi:DNA-binding transcriptional regulator of glucitol operon